MGHCPENALRIIERDADEFDEEAVEELLQSQGRPSLKENETQHAAPACPSARVQSFGAGQLSPCQQANVPRAENTASALTQWPVQITLVPPTAPFLNGSDLLIAADCTPFAYANFHEEFMKDRSVLVGCPKLDDQKFYVNKLAETFAKSDIKSITVAVMEVPCCQAFPNMVKAALQAAGKDIPVTVKIIGIKGDLKQ